MRFTIIFLVLIAIVSIDVAIAEDQSVPDRTINGHVYDVQTKQPVSGAWVYCQDTNCPKQLTDSDGYYAMKNCFSPSSTYRIKCTKNGYTTAKNTAKTDSSGKAKVDFNLEPESSSAKISWKKTFGGAKFDYAWSVQQTTDGGYIIGGYTSSYGTSLESVWLIKTDSQGNKEWDRTFPRFAGEGCAVEQTSDGGYIIADAVQPYRESVNKILSPGKILVTRTDSQGSTLWEKTFTASGFWFILPIIHRTNDGGYIIACNRMSDDAGNKCECWLIKIDENGMKQWDLVIEGSACNKGCFVQQTNDQGYIIGCDKPYQGTDNLDAWLIKADSQGNRLWDKTFGGIGINEAYSVQQTSDDGYIIAGTKDSSTWIMKTDAQGNQEWERTFGGYMALTAQQTKDGGYITAGSSGPFWADKTNFWLIKVDSQGNQEWIKNFEGSKVDHPFSVQQTMDDGYIIAGNTESQGAGGRDIWLIKTDSEGN